MFGGVCANRLSLAAGPVADFEESPGSETPTVLADAVAEADGKRIPVKCIFYFRDVAGGSRP
jgi:hypothetical protein